MSARFRLLLVVACVSLAALPAGAQGHMLHGFGPINSAMGGAGTALLEDSVAALAFNPALIGTVEGNQLSFTTEFFKDGAEIHTTLSLPGSPSGTAVASKETVIYPAFGWMSRHPDKKLAIGFGLIGLGGFRTDYPQDSASILFGQPPFGFGRVFSDYRLTKIPVALAYQVSPKLSIGASANVYYAEFAQSPLPHDIFDVGANGARWYPTAGNMDGRFGLAGQFGFVYQATPKVSLGASFTTPQNFQGFQWNSTYVDPGHVLYGRHRTVTAQLDGPASFSFGTGLKLSAKTHVAIDGMFTKYEGVAGFGSPGGVIDGIINPFGWRNVWTFKAGVQHKATDKLTLRLGYNYSQTPLRSEVILTAGTIAPQTFQSFFCGGLGLKAFPFLTAEASFYYSPRESVRGPFPVVQGFDIGTVETSNKLTSALIGLNFTF
ncbi:MAG: OmpP1/FadL family transporter [Vicinamibacteria bacterium]